MPNNRSEESHDLSEEYILRTLSVGYFANAQYDVLFLYVILNGVKDPTEEVRRLCFGTLVVGYFACAQYDVKAQVGYFANAQYDGVFFIMKSGA